MLRACKRCITQATTRLSSIDFGHAGVNTCATSLVDGGSIQHVLPRERGELEVIADFQLPIAYFQSAAAPSQTLSDTG